MHAQHESEHTEAKLAAVAVAAAVQHSREHKGRKGVGNRPLSLHTQSQTRAMDPCSRGSEGERLQRSRVAEDGRDLQTQSSNSQNPQCMAEGERVRRCSKMWSSK